MLFYFIRQNSVMYWIQFLLSFFFICVTESFRSNILKDKNKKTKSENIQSHQLKEDDRDDQNPVFDWFGLIWFYGIIAIVGYLMPNPFYTYKQFYFKQFSLA